MILSHDPFDVRGRKLRENSVNLLRKCMNAMYLEVTKVYLIPPVYSSLSPTWVGVLRDFHE